MKSLFKVFLGLTVLVLAYGYCQAMYIAPREATMGEVQRIFYYHVPSAWTAFLLFFLNLLASVWYLVRRSQAADALALSSAEVGVSFCTIVLITGPIWARPVWGIWWTWDMRLTTTLVLWLIYVSYLVLRHYGTGGQVPVLAAVLSVFGFVDVPIVYMAIRWFRTQHPQPVIGGGEGSGLDPRMWVAVLWNWAGFLMLAGLFVWTRYRQAIASHELEEAHARASLDYETEGTR